MCYLLVIYWCCIDENIKKITELSDRLDEENIGLTESVKIYEEASNLIKDSYKILNETKGKVTILTEEINKLTEEDF